jgi:hypothetical protein
LPRSRDEYILLGRLGASRRWTGKRDETIVRSLTAATARRRAREAREAAAEMEAIAEAAEHAGDVA